MSHYDEVLKEARSKATNSAREYIPKLYDILVDEEHKTPEDARKIIEHDLLEYWSKATVVKYLPQETKDEDKVKAGKAGAKATNLVLAGGQTVTTKSDEMDSGSNEGNKDEEEPTELELANIKIAQLEDALHKVSDKQFVPATQLENKPLLDTVLDDDTVFQYLRSRAKETDKIKLVDRVGSGAIVQAVSQYKTAFKVAELFLRVIE
jgi:hypothetical protein